MDYKLRKLEQEFNSDPTEANKKALLRARERAQFEPDCLEDILLLQEDLKETYAIAKQHLITASKKNFFKFLEQIFEVNSNLDRVTFLSYVPGFMDGDPLRLDACIIVCPKMHFYYGLVSAEEAFINYTAEKDRKNTLQLSSSIFNRNLTKKDIDRIASQFWAFYPYLDQYFGTNVRITFQRQKPGEDYYKWYPKGVFWTKEDYNWD